MDIYTLYTKPLIYDKALDKRIKKRWTKKEKRQKKRSLEGERIEQGCVLSGNICLQLRIYGNACDRTRRVSKIGRSRNTIKITRNGETGRIWETTRKEHTKATKNEPRDSIRADYERVCGHIALSAWVSKYKTEYIPPVIVHRLIPCFYFLRSRFDLGPFLFNHLFFNSCFDSSNFP